MASDPKTCSTCEDEIPKPALAPQEPELCAACGSYDEFDAMDDAADEAYDRAVDA